MSIDSSFYRELVRPVFAGRRWLVFGGPRVLRLARALHADGAPPPFVLLSAPPGVPTEEGVFGGQHVVPVRSSGSGVELIWAFEEGLRKLPAQARRAIDAWDPDATAQALGLFTMSTVRSVAGRPRYADRPRAWAGLEDKTRLPAFLDAIGVRRGRLAVVRAEPTSIDGAVSRLDRGGGVVISGDDSAGTHGGGWGVRRVFDAKTLAEAQAFFRGRAKRVRVMPFVEGIPCSVHGIVFDEGVSVFRPMEMLVLRKADGGFLYAGTASFWDPEPREREELRGIARRVGRGLAERVGFRGAFTLDGVMAEQGFVPTEINTRIGAAFSELHQRTPELPLERIALAAQAGERLDFRPGDLERGVLEAADERRAGSARVALAGPARSHFRLDVVDGAAGMRAARPDEAPDGRLGALSTGVSTFVEYVPDPERVPRGPSFAATARRSLELADRELGLGLGALEVPLLE